MANSVPDALAAMLPEIPLELKNAVNRGDRYFGCVVAPGDKVGLFIGSATKNDYVGDLVLKMCNFSIDYGNFSQWIVASDKKTKKLLQQIIDDTSKSVKNKPATQKND